MIRGFHHELSKQADLETFLDVNREFVVDLEELYDLDIRAHKYKAQYEAMKALDGLERDHAQLKSEVEALGAQLLAKNTARWNRLLLWLTWIGLVVGGLGAVGAIGYFGNIVSVLKSLF